MATTKRKQRRAYKKRNNGIAGMEKTMQIGMQAASNVMIAGMGIGLAGSVIGMI